MKARLASAYSRSRLFWLLAEGLLHGFRAESWLYVPDGSEGPGKAGSPLAEAWENLVDLLRTLDDEASARLAVEHTRLFGGLREGEGPPPPFESAWLPRSEAGEVVQSVTREYAAAGFADIDLDAGPQDHLAVELKFMALLAMKEAEALRHGSLDEAEVRVGQQRRFLHGRLLGWVPRWIDGLANQTQEPVYWALTGLISAGLAQAAEEFVEAGAAMP